MSVRYRLARSLPHLLHVPDAVEGGAGFQSLSESIDTTTPGGRLVLHVIGALAEYERELVQERTRAGMQAAKGRRVHVGRPRKLSADQLDHARQLVESGERTQAGAASLSGVDVGDAAAGTEKGYCAGSRGRLPSGTLQEHL